MNIPTLRDRARDMLILPPAVAAWMLLTAVGALVAAYVGGSGLAWAFWTAMSFLLLVFLVCMAVNLILQGRTDAARRRGDAARRLLEHADIAIARIARDTKIVMHTHDGEMFTVSLSTLAQYAYGRKVMYAGLRMVELRGACRDMRPEAPKEHPVAEPS